MLVLNFRHVYGLGNRQAIQKRLDSAIQITTIKHLS